MQSAHAVVGEQARRRPEPALGIDDDARRIGADDAPHRQLRIVGDRAADADDDRIDQSAQPMQMGKSGGPVDIAGMSGLRGDAPTRDWPICPTTARSSTLPRARVPNIGPPRTRQDRCGISEDSGNGRPGFGRIDDNSRALTGTDFCGR